MLFYTVIIILLLSNFVPSLTTDTFPTSPPPISTSTESTIAEEELQKAIKFTQALFVFIDFFNSTEPLGKNVKGVLEASRACKFVLQKGLSLNKIKGMKDEPQLDTVNLQLEDVIIPLNVRTSHAGKTLRQPKYSIQEQIIHPIETLYESFQRMLPDFHKEDTDNFQYTCQRHGADDILDAIISRFEYNVVNQTVVDDNYSDLAYKNLYTIFYNSMKQAISLYPMCRNARVRPHNREEVVTRTFEVIQAFNSNFTAIDNERKDKYWSNENIFNIVKKFILGDYTVGPPYTENNDKIADKISKYLAENFESFGYTYHVGVSNTGTNGNADTLIQCSTECKYIYDINNKDVYIIRNKQVPVYNECSFLSSKPNTNYHCSDNRDSTDLTELAQKIQSKCNSTAFSLVRKRLKYASLQGYEYYKKFPGFSQKCIGDIYVVMANSY